MKRWTGMVVVAVWLAWPMVVWADAEELVEEQEEAVEQPEQEQPAEEEDESTGPNAGAVYLNAGIDYTSTYMFRGLVIADEGVIVQPWFQGGITLFEGEGVVNSVDILIDSWNSLHFDTEEGAAIPTVPTKWFESDYYLTLSITLIDSLTFDAGYWWYTSPNGSFSTLEEINLALYYDDSGLWPVTSFFGGLQPFVSLGIEMDGQSDLGANEGIYLGPGIEPSFSFGNEDGFLVNLTLPMEVGLSLSDYYENAAAQDELFGMFDLGLVVGIPLTFIPERFGGWEVSGNFHAVILGDTLKEYNGQWDPVTGELTEESDPVRMHGGAGLSLSY
ncbi:MAG: hypothetical protein JW797_02400 [Bradymonadales bacterium]|nr:hypothetical protein [Bradymonadales bacterium]